MIGDWLNEAVEQGYTVRELRQYKWVANKVKASLRRDALTWSHHGRVARKVELYTRVYNLSWAHHREVASLAPEEQAYWLNEAVRLERLLDYRNQRL